MANAFHRSIAQSSFFSLFTSVLIQKNAGQLFGVCWIYGATRCLALGICEHLVQSLCKHIIASFRQFFTVCCFSVFDLPAAKDCPWFGLGTVHTGLIVGAQLAFTNTATSYGALVTTANLSFLPFSNAGEIDVRSKHSFGAERTGAGFHRLRWRKGTSVDFP